MTGHGMNIGVYEVVFGCSKAGNTIAGGSQLPAWAAVIRLQKTTDFNGRISAAAMKREASDAASRRRIGQVPAKPVPQLIDLRSIRPAAAAVSRDVNGSRFCSCKNEPRFLWMAGKPANVLLG